MLADRERAHMRHLTHGGRLDHIGIRLKQFQPQQPIMVGGLMLGRNPQPFVVRIEVRIRHGLLSAVDRDPVVK